MIRLQGHQRAPKQTLTSKLTFIFCLVIWLSTLSKEQSTVSSRFGLFRTGHAPVPPPFGRLYQSG